MALLQLRQVDKFFSSGHDRLQILQQLDLDMHPGEIATIGGQSGCGKSTLLNLIGGMDRPSGGSIIFQGKALSQMKERELTLHRRQSVAIIFQMHYLLQEITAIENVMLPALICQCKPSEARARALDLLQQVGLRERLHHYPYQLSGGECQRVAVARALINRPQLVLADEPTGSLDEGSSLLVEELLFSLMRTSGLAMLLVTHDQKLARRGDVCYLMHQGRLQQC